MTLLEPIPTGTLREGCIPVLETERLTLRAPSLEDAEAIAKLANDRRIAENTASIPHPYRLHDAEAFITRANGSDTQANFLVTLADGTVAGACGLAILDGPAPEIGFWLGLPFWGAATGPRQCAPSSTTPSPMPATTRCRPAAG